MDLLQRKNTEKIQIPLTTNNKLPKGVAKSIQKRGEHASYVG